MNYYKLKKGKEEINISVPTSWSDVTYGQYKAITKNKDITDLKALSILLKVDNIEDVMIADNYSNLIKDISFLQKELDIENYVPPTKVRIENKEYRISLDIGKETIGQYEDLKQSLKSSKVDEVAMACAIYIQPEIDGHYNINKANELLKNINQLPCNFVLVVGNFFLSRLLGLKTGLMSNYLKASTRKKRLKQGIRNLVRHLDL